MLKKGKRKKKGKEKRKEKKKTLYQKSITIESYCLDYN